MMLGRPVHVLGEAEQYIVWQRSPIFERFRSSRVASPSSVTLLRNFLMRAPVDYKYKLKDLDFLKDLAVQDLDKNTLCAIVPLEVLHSRQVQRL